MGLSSASGRINTTTGAVGNTVVVSGLSFQPKLILFAWNGRTDTVDAAGRANARRGFGYAVSTSDRGFITTLAQDTPTSMVTNRMQGNAQCIGLTTTADAIDGLMDVSSINSDGFTLIIDDVFTASFSVHWYALGGTDITNVQGGTFTKENDTGSQIFSSLSFQPTAILLFTTGQTTTNNSVATDAMFMLGAATGASDEHVYHAGSNDGAANAQAISYCRDGEIAALFDAGITVVNMRAELTTMRSDGFELNWLEQTTPTASVIFYVAIQGPAIKVFDVLTQTDTTTDINVTGMTNTPVGGLVISACHAENSADAVIDDDEWSMGFFTSSSDRRSVSATDDDAAGTAVVSTGISYDEVYQNLLHTAGTVEGEMDVISLNSDGVTFRMDDADPAQMYVWGVLFAPSLQNITGVGAIASAEAFGTTELELNVTGVGNIATAAAFGTTKVNLWITTSGIASAETFGSHTVSVAGGGNQTITLSGITSLETFGTLEVDQQIRPSGIASLETFGTLKVNEQIRPSGIASLEAFGTTSVELTISGVGNIASAAAFGTTSVELSIRPSGIASLESFGTLELDQQIRLIGIASLETFGTPVVSVAGSSQTITLSGIASLEAFGMLRVNEQVRLTSIASLEAFGTLKVNQSILISGSASGESFGTLTMIGGADVIILPFIEGNVPIYLTSSELSPVVTSKALTELPTSGNPMVYSTYGRPKSIPTSRDLL